MNMPNIPQNEKILIAQQNFFEAQLNSATDTFDVMSKLKISLKDTLKESKNSQNAAKWMFIGMFALGIALFYFAIHFAFMGEQFFAIAFGTFGMVDIIAQLLADPPMKLQDSRSNYAQLTVGVLNWFTDLNDKSSLSVQNNELNKAILNSNLSFDEKLRLNNECLNYYTKVSDAQMSNTVNLLRLIEELAEPTKRKKTKKTLKKVREEVGTNTKQT